MDFEMLIRGAKSGDFGSFDTLFEMYRPLILKESVVDDAFDEDLYQELCITLLRCIKGFEL